MNILIVGGAGYIGGVTAHIAVKAGHTVTVLDNLSTGRRYNVPDGAEFVQGDICDQQFMQSFFTNRTFDTVMHFAARIQVAESMQLPYEYFATNTFGVLNVVDNAVKSDVKNYILSSTAATYGEPDHTPLRETDSPHPVNPYGWSKLAAEHLLASYQTTHDLQWAAFRYFNVAGAYDGVGTDYPFVSHIIPKLLLSMKTKQPINITGDDYPTPDGTCVRDYVHVQDIARAHLLGAEVMANGTPLNQPINLSSGNGYSVREVAETFNKVTGAELPIHIGPRRAGDPAMLFASNSLAKDLIGWQPELDLERMIRDHYEWFIVQENPNAPA